MTQTAPAADQAAPPPTTPRVSSRGRVARRAVLAVVGAMLLWLVGGLAWSGYTVATKAGTAQTELQRFRDTLKLGDQAAAKRHLDRGKQALRDAEGASHWPQVRLAHRTPYVGRTVTDLNHLIAAAGIMTTSADDALKISEEFAGDNSKLFHNNTFSLPAIQQARTAVTSLAAGLVRADRELTAVAGRGPLGGTALAKRDSAREQITALRSELVSLGPVLEALPAAVGASGPKTYLVIIGNPAESRAPGGAPLSVAFLAFDAGRMTIQLKGQTSELTNINQRLLWTPLPGDPFLVGTRKRPFVNANVNPDFSVAAQQLMRAAVPNFGITTDGVIALDVVAVAHLLRATGPIQSPTYGELNGDNVAQKLLVDAYVNQGTTEQAKIDARHVGNDELMSTMLTRLTEGGGTLGKARALGKAVPGRHLQMYFADTRLQALVSDKRAAGQPRAPAVGNLSAVYTQNGNQSKNDVFQQRTLAETVQLNGDGSATVHRTVSITNATPPYHGPLPDPTIGYLTRWVGLKVLNLMPPGAVLTASPTVPAQATVKQGVDQAGRTYAEAFVTIPPGGSTALSWDYTLPHAARADGNGLRFLDYVEPQPLLNPTTLQLTVVPPPGWTFTGINGLAKAWKVAADHSATLSMPVIAARVLTLRASPAG